MPHTQRGNYARKPKKAKKASQAVKSYVDRRLKSLGEMKHHFVGRSTAFESTNQSRTVVLSEVAQGDSRLSREGKEIDVRGLQVRYYCDPSANCTGDRVRIILWQFKGNTADVTVVGDSGQCDEVLFEQSTSAYTRLASPFKQDVKDYKILYDKMHIIPAFASDNYRSHSDQRMVVVNIAAKKLLNKIAFNASANTGTNHIFLTVLGNLASGTTASTSINYSAMMSFKDI